VVPAGIDRGGGGGSMRRMLSRESFAANVDRAAKIKSTVPQLADLTE